MRHRRLAAAALTGSLGLLATSVTLGPSHASAGACAGRASVALQLVTPAGAIPIEGGGPLVGQIAGSDRIEMGTPDPDPFATLRAHGPGGALRPAQRALAPGLHRLSFAHARPGRYRLAGVTQTATVELTASPATTIAAPQLESATLEITPLPSGPWGGPSEARQLHVALRTGAPADAYALLLYPEGSDPSGQALNWSGVSAGARRAAFHQGAPSRCGPNIPFGGLPVGNSRVAVAWVTSRGQLSPLSNLVAIQP